MFIDLNEKSIKKFRNVASQKLQTSSDTIKELQKLIHKLTTHLKAFTKSHKGPLITDMSKINNSG